MVLFYTYLCNFRYRFYRYLDHIDMYMNLMCYDKFRILHKDSVNTRLHRSYNVYLPTQACTNMTH